MLNGYINLWTIHPPDFSIKEGRLDHSKSEYYKNTPGVKQAYPELWKRINIPDGQIIWCYTDKSDITKTGIIKKRWDLYLPVSEVIQFVDDMVWNRILGIKCDVPPSLRNQWRDESQKKFPSNPATAKVYEKECYNNYWMKKPKTGSWWDELFVSRIGECTSALIRHPVREDCIKNEIRWCC